MYTVTFTNGENTYPLSMNGTYIPLSVKGFRFSGVEDFKKGIQSQIANGLDDNFSGAIHVMNAVPRVRKWANEAILYLTGDGCGGSNIVVKISDKNILGIDQFIHSSGGDSDYPIAPATTSATPLSSGSGRMEYGVGFFT